MEHKEAVKDGSRYNILWHWDSAYRRYETTSFILAITKWNQINNKASRLFLHNDKLKKSWCNNNKWKNKLLSFTSSEQLSITPFHIIVVWLNKENNAYVHKLFDSEQTALSHYNQLKSDTKLFAVDHQIKEVENETNVVNQWVSFIVEPDKTYFSAFSHRDFDQPNPLMDALYAHIQNIEFDLHLIDSELIIGHDLKHCKQQNTLQFVYLDPLVQLIKENKLTKCVNLYLDFKSDAKQSYNCLNTIIEQKYFDFVTFWEFDEKTKHVLKHDKLINIVITGNRDIESIVKTPNMEVTKRYVAFDGRIEHMDDAQMNAEYMPMISDNFGKIFPNCNWKNGYVLNDDDKKRLVEYIKKCRNKGIKLRFWATIDSEKLWQQLIDLDVEKDTLVINTDNIQKLIAFLIRNGY